MKLLFLSFGISCAIYAQDNSVPPRLEVSHITVEPSSTRVPSQSITGEIVVQVYSGVMEKAQNSTATVCIKLVPLAASPSKGDLPRILSPQRTERVHESPTIFRFYFSLGPTTSPGQYRVEASVTSDNKFVRIMVPQDQNAKAFLTVLQ